ncbi:secretion protein HlyD [Psychromonas marina]|uniref:Secretion protein HlyD n=1 Tax=Psychromonas marina TaxID=88364 RepID=A0ABQ6E5C8_9GAMM|nr:HlyD family secretion protein [Psychromonas marina]GLS92390.1 secretion protein HlyD [Psychromonas marina]
MKKPFIAVTLILTALLVVTFSIYQPNTITTDNAYVQSDVTSISPEVSGQVNKVYVKDNQWINKGAPLFSIDDKDFVANKKIAISLLDVANAALSANQTQIEMQEIKIAQAGQTIHSSEANAVYQRAELQRYTSLLNKQSVSTNQFEAQRSTSIDSESLLASAKLGLTAEQKQYQALLAQRLQLSAQLEQAQANLRLVNIALERTIIKAPLDGFITNRQVQVGKYVTPGMGLITMVPNYIWVEANFKETQLETLKKGQTVEVVLDMFSDRKLTGHVTSITPATGSQFSLLPAQNATGNFVKVVQRVPVRIQLDIPDDLKQRIYPGLSATVAISTLTSETTVIN